jgi:hypothetical protein
MSNWWIESESNPMYGEYVLGATFAEACRRAMAYCTTDSSRWTVKDGENRWAATVTMRGVEKKSLVYSREY